MKALIYSTMTVMAAIIFSACAASNPSAKVKPYPFKTCIVTGNALGSMGDPVDFVYNGQQLKFCCRPCVKKFKANPDKYMSKF